MAHNKKDINNCIICNNKIIGNYIEYLPEGNKICDNTCLIKYRKKYNKNE
jgi:hypothetical protein